MNTAAVFRYGETVTVTDDIGTHSVRAFLQPVSLTAPETPEATPAGLRDGRRWRIIMEPIELSGNVSILYGGREYLLLRREQIGGGDHIEGLLRLKGGSAQC